MSTPDPNAERKGAAAGRAEAERRFGTAKQPHDPPALTTADIGQAAGRAEARRRYPSDDQH